MINRTELSEAILTDETAQKMIDYVSPIYGDSYVGLWLFQAIGTVMGRVGSIAEALKNEAIPTTSVLMLDYWEQHYGIPTNPNLTIKQRQERIREKRLSRGPCNPYKLAAAVSAALGGVEVDIEENVGKNTFLVNIREAIADIKPAVAILEKKKPAHLIYQIRVATQMIAEADIKVAIAMTQAESYTVEVH